MKLIYKNLDYLLVETDYTKSGFKHNFLLFTKDGEARRAYSVQMAVNYISSLPTASFDQEVDEQSFVACIPITEYPEIKDFLENGCKQLDLYKLADNHATRLVRLITKLLNNDKDANDKDLLNSSEKLSQFDKLLELNCIDKPQSIYTFDELYHTYLNKQRVFKDSLNYKLKVRTLSSDLEFLLIQPNSKSEILSKYNALVELKETVKKFRFSWYADLEKTVREYGNRISYI